MAQRYWAGDDALGRRLTLGGKDWLQIVGIAKDVKNRNLSEARQPFLYVPLAGIPRARTYRDTYESTLVHATRRQASRQQQQVDWSGFGDASRERVSIHGHLV